MPDYLRSIGVSYEASSISYLELIDLQRQRINRTYEPWVSQSETSNHFSVVSHLQLIMYTVTVTHVHSYTFTQLIMYTFTQLHM